MSVSLTLSIAGPDAAKLKERIVKEALKNGMSVSEFVVNCVVIYLRENRDA